MKNLTQVLSFGLLAVACTQATFPKVIDVATTIVQDIAKTVADLAGFIKPQLVVLDAVRVLASNGPAGGNLADVKRRDTIVAGVDQVAVDAFGATLLGLGPQDIGYVVEGHARGLGNMNYAALSPARVEV